MKRSDGGAKRGRCGVKRGALKNTFTYIKRDRLVFEPIPLTFAYYRHHIRCMAFIYVSYSKL